MPEPPPSWRTPIATLGKPSAMPPTICMPTMTGTFTKASSGRDGNSTLAGGGSPLANEGMRSVLDQWQSSRRLGQQRWGNFNGGFRP